MAGCQTAPANRYISQHVCGTPTLSSEPRVTCIAYVPILAAVEVPSIPRDSLSGVRTLTIYHLSVRCTASFSLVVDSSYHSGRSGYSAIVLAMAQHYEVWYEFPLSSCCGLSIDLCRMRRL